jgi:hypothetical protein
MQISDFPMVDVLKIKGLDGYRVWLRFTDGQEGIWDMRAMVEEGGPMLEPLRDMTFFKRVFVEYGAPTWPNGFDVDAANLYARLRDAGLLASSVAAE